MAEGIQGIGSLASIFTRRRFGVSVNFKENEAKAIAKPIARLIQRRYKVKSDLNDVADTTGIFASVLSWVDRLAEESPGAQTGPPDPRFAEPDRPARHAAPESTLLSDEPVRSAAPTPRPTPASQVFSPAHEREVGSGPLKDAIQGMG